MSTIADHILALPVWVALILVFLLPALESSAFVGFVFPGEITLILGGVLASQSKVPLAAVLIAGILGAVIGDSVGYAVGRRWGRQMLHGTVGRFVKHEHLDRGEKFLSERAGRAVFLGRFTAALRVLIPGLAGMARMPYRTFLAWNVAGGLVWATAAVMLGFLAGNSWRKVEHLASRIGIGMLVLVVAAVVVSRLLRGERRQAVAGWFGRLGDTRAVTALRERFPASTHWVAARFGRGDRGFSLTLWVAIAAGGLWMLVGISQDVLAREELVTWDAPVQAWMLAHREPVLSSILQVLTWLGSSVVLVPVLLAAAALVYQRSRRAGPGVRLLVGYAGVALVTALVAALVPHPEPGPATALTPSNGSGYPSGHAVQICVAVGSILLMILREREISPRYRARAAAVVPAVALVLVVAFSRVYLGVGWTTDVLGGLALGIAWLSLWQIAERVVLRDPA